MTDSINQKYLQGNCEELLPQFGDGEFDLIITSPPYNMGKEYESAKSIEEYLADQTKVIEQLVRLTSNRGSICWQVGTFLNKEKEVFPLDIFYYSIFKNLGLKLRNRIIWQFGHGLHTSNRFSGRYEVILWFTKTNDYIFNLDSVRVPAKYPGKTHHKGPKKGKISGNPKGKNPSDIWDIVLEDWEKEIWDIPNVKANHAEKTLHPCQYPIELVERCILALTNSDSKILDPYAGVGSTLIAAAKNNRDAIGMELFPKYIAIGEDRLDQFRKGTLKFRETGTPIFQPNENMAVAKKPEHFLY
jgi:adenine-specific DNA-methyltransferase